MRFTQVLHPTLCNPNIPRKIHEVGFLAHLSCSWHSESCFKKVGSPVTSIHQSHAPQKKRCHSVTCTLSLQGAGAKHVAPAHVGSPHTESLHRVEDPTIVLQGTRSHCEGGSPSGAADLESPFPLGFFNGFVFLLFLLSLNSLSSIKIYIITYRLTFLMCKNHLKNPIQGNQISLHRTLFFHQRYSWQGGHQHQSNTVHRLPNSGGFHPEPCSLTNSTSFFLWRLVVSLRFCGKFSWQWFF